MKICVAGACGRMGRRILELTLADPDLAIGGAIDIVDNDGKGISIGGETVTVSSDVAGQIAQSDVLIDFTAPEACIRHATAAAQAGKPVVIGTTGLSDVQKAELQTIAAQVPVVFAPNMSVGVNLLFKLAGEVAQVLGLDYNVEIIELHHNQKKDSPSGTAVRLGERVAEGLGLDYAKDTVYGREGLIGARPRAEIGMHSVRGGDIVGEHTVSFIGPGERVELVHKAQNRDNFARGALIAAKFLASAKPGLYDMQDVLGLR